MLVALAPILLPLLAGSDLAAVLAGVTGVQWLALGDAILTALPDELGVFKKLHPFLAGLADEVKLGGAKSAPTFATMWLQSNAEAAMRLQPGISSES